jgi:endonuclease/exonuclease/phosphatase family metal-dependent hydrolase
MTDTTASIFFSDALVISKTPHYGPKASFAGNFLITGLIDHRIDCIFVKKNIEVLKHAILSDSWNGNLASDHLPVLTEVRIQ